MDARLTALLGELHDHGVEHDRGTADRLDRLRNLEPDTAAVLALLARAGRAQNVLEIGTSNGYSTIWLADAVRSTGGRLVSVDTDSSRCAEAAANLKRAGLRSLVDLRVQDAGDALAQSPDEHWDLIFLDAERPAYAGYWADIVRSLRRSGVLVVDNVISHAHQVADFRALVTADERVFEALVPTGAGALLAVRNPRPL